MSVYANDLAIAGKAKQGKSTAAFPDPCFSPPAPPAGWVVIPYANTAYAKDTANASKTVFIEGKPVMLKDKSYFKTSTGNEAADGPKGLITGVKQGKAYFASWSMDVKAEGYNVCRHTDMMTHNHGSWTGNTGVWHYVDEGWFSIKDCKGMQKKVDKACQGIKDKCKGNCKPKHSGKEWKSKYCRFLSFKPKRLGDLESPVKLLQDLRDRIGQIDIMQGIVDKVVDEAIDIAAKKLAKLGFKVVGTKFVPIAGWVYSIATAAEDFSEVRYYKRMYEGAISEGKRITGDIQNIRQDIQQAIDGLSKVPPELNATADKIADWQRTAATANDCIRLRKCMLVPFKDTTRNSKVSKTDTKGCCPGQTGHHLIPDAYVKNAGCKKYKEGDAPTVCAEGTDASTGGSHEDLHMHTNEELISYEADGRLTYKNGEEKKSYGDVRDGVLRAHAKTFPFSACPRQCLKEQLDNYYKGCGKLTVRQIGRRPRTGEEGSAD